MLPIESHVWWLTHLYRFKPKEGGIRTFTPNRFQGERFTRVFLSGVIPLAPRPDGHLQTALPELHVWLASPESGEIIDFTTGLWPEAARQILGEPWIAPLPPKYLWTFGNRLPVGVRYRPDRDAIDCVIAILRLQGREYP